MIPCPVATPFGVGPRQRAESGLSWSFERIDSSTWWHLCLPTPCQSNAIPATSANSLCSLQDPGTPNTLPATCIPRATPTWTLSLPASYRLPGPHRIPRRNHKSEVHSFHSMLRGSGFQPNSDVTRARRAADDSLQSLCVFSVSYTWTRVRTSFSGEKTASEARKADI